MHIVSCVLISYMCRKMQTHEYVYIIRRNMMQYADCRIVLERGALYERLAFHFLKKIEDLCSSGDANGLTKELSMGTALGHCVRAPLHGRFPSLGGLINASSNAPLPNLTELQQPPLKIYLSTKITWKTRFRLTLHRVNCPTRHSWERLGVSKGQVVELLGHAGNLGEAVQHGG